AVPLAHVDVLPPVGAPDEALGGLLVEGHLARAFLYEEVGVTIAVAVGQLRPGDVDAAAGRLPHGAALPVADRPGAHRRGPAGRGRRNRGRRRPGRRSRAGREEQGADPQGSRRPKEPVGHGTAWLRSFTRNRPSGTRVMMIVPLLKNGYTLQAPTICGWSSSSG